MPPFNRPREGVELPMGHELFEVPVYGLSISAAIMECFELPGVKDLAEKLDVLIPPYKVSTFVQKKMFKVAPPTRPLWPNALPSAFPQFHTPAAPIAPRKRCRLRARCTLSTPLTLRA